VKDGPKSLGGVEPLTLTDEVDRERRRKTDNKASSSADESRRSKPRKGEPGEIGTALRTVYQTTVQEDIPSEMLDLLGKLG
jgi:Anti-sigma factor NepR